MDTSASTHYAGKVEVWAEVDTVPLSALYARTLAGTGNEAMARRFLADACWAAIEAGLAGEGIDAGFIDLTDPVCDLADAITGSPAPGYVYENPQSRRRRIRAERAAARKARLAAVA